MLATSAARPANPPDRQVRKEERLRLGHYPCNCHPQLSADPGAHSPVGLHRPPILHLPPRVGTTMGVLD